MVSSACPVFSVQCPSSGDSVRDRPQAAAPWALFALKLSFGLFMVAWPVSSHAKSEPTVDRPETFFADLPDIVAQVGDEAIGAQKLRQEALPRLVMRIEMARREKKKIKHSHVRKWASQLVNTTLEEIIGRRVLLGYAKAAGFVPDLEAAREEALGLYRASQERFGEAQVAENLRQQGSTPDEAVAQFAEQLADQKAVQRWIEAKLDPQHPVSEDDARAFYRRHRATFRVPETFRTQHILVRADKASLSHEQMRQASHRAAELRTRLEQGEGFVDLAQAHSDCSTRERGGELPPFRSGQMRRSFERAVDKLEQGEISPVVQTEHGFHIVRLQERVAPRTVPFDEAREGLERRLRAQKVGRTIRDLIEKGRAEQGVKILVPHK